MAYTVMAYIVMAHIAMAHRGMACIVMAYTGLRSYGATTATSISAIYSSTASARTHERTHAHIRRERVRTHVACTYTMRACTHAAHGYAREAGLSFFTADRQPTPLLQAAHTTITRTAVSAHLDALVWHVAPGMCFPMQTSSFLHAAMRTCS